MINDPKEMPKVVPTDLHDLASSRISKEIKLTSIRWMIRADLPKVENIERRCRKHPWDKEDFMRNLRERNVIGLAGFLQIEGKEILAGFIIYELKTRKIAILNLAIDPDFQRKRVGEQIVKKMISKLTPSRRAMLEVPVRETNLGGQLFLKHMGFKADNVINGFFLDSGEDAYVMRYQLKEKN